MRTPLILSMKAICVCVVFIAPDVHAQPCFVDRVQPTDGAVFGNFGISVALDGNVGVIGAQSVIPSATGNAYVYSYDGSSWNLAQELIPFDPVPGMNFGRAVAIHEDAVVVDANTGDYVFRNVSGTWIEEQKLVAWDDGLLGIGGRSISQDRLVVGVRGDTTNGNLAGAVYVFRHDGKEWVPEQKLFPSDAQPAHEFGMSVSMDGDLIAIGAPRDGEAGCQPDEPAPCRPGAIYLFALDKARGLWIQQQKLLPPVVDGVNYWGLRFGKDVALHGDTLIVGTNATAVWGTPCGHTSCGIAFVYTRDIITGLWSHSQTLLPEQPGIRRFGWAVDVDGDYAIIGARDSGVAGFGPGSPYEGAALLYERDTDGLWQSSAMFLPEPSFPQAFGRAVAISGNHTLVGAPFENGQAGAAYFHKINAPGDLDCNGVVNVHDLLILVVEEWGPCPEPEFLFTEWMSCPADINGDGVVDVFDLLLLLANWG